MTLHFHRTIVSHFPGNYKADYSVQAGPFENPNTELRTTESLHFLSQFHLRTRYTGRRNGYLNVSMQ